MAFLRKLFGSGTSTSPSDRALYLYARCEKCGTVVRARVDLANDLAADYGDTEAEGYTLSKELMDDRCFRIMRAEIQFDNRRRETARSIAGGSFVTEAEYEAARTPQPPK